MKRVKRYIVYFLSLLLVYSPLLQSAAELSDADRQQAVQQAQSLQKSIHGGKNAITYTQAQQILKKDIGEGNTAELKKVGTDAQKLNEYSGDYKSNINSESEKDPNAPEIDNRPSLEGQAYKLVKEDQMRVQNDRDDITKNVTTDGQKLNYDNSIFDSTKYALDNLNKFANEFAGCSESVKVETKEKPVANPEYHYCERNFSKIETHSIIHKIFLEKATAENETYPLLEAADGKSGIATVDGTSTFSVAEHAQMISFNSPMMLVYKRKLKVLHPKEIETAYITNLEFPTMGKVFINGKVVADKTHPQLRKHLFTRAGLTRAELLAVQGEPRHKYMLPGPQAYNPKGNTVYAYNKSKKSETAVSLPDELYVTHNNAPSTYSKDGDTKVRANANAKRRVLELFNTNKPLRDGVYIKKHRTIKKLPKGGWPARGGPYEGVLGSVNEFIENPFKDRNPIDITNEFKNLKENQELNIEIWSLFINFPDPIMQVCIEPTNLCLFQHRMLYRHGEWSPADNIQREADTKLSLMLTLGAKKKDTYSNPKILDLIAKGNDENTRITTTCKHMRSGLDPKDRTSCITVDGESICPDDLIDSPKGLEHLSKMCMEYEVNVEKKTCGFDAEGKPVCFFRSETPDECEPYRTNPQCKLVGNLCAKHDSTENIQKLEYEKSNLKCSESETTLEKWDCGVPLKIKDYEVSNNYECPGKIACIGTDCIGEYTEKDVPTNFGKVSALVKALEMATQDNNCYEPGTNVIPNDRLAKCKIFTGTVKSCGDPIGSIGLGTSFKLNRCCNPKGVSINPKDFIATTMLLARLHSGIMHLENGNIIKGAYQTLQKPIADGISYVTKPLTGAIENMTASTKKFFEPITKYVKETIAKLKKKAAELMKKLFAKKTSTSTAQATGSATAAQQAGEEAAKTITNKVMQGVMQGANAIMLAYTIYQVGELANQIVNACEKIAENNGTGYFDLAINKKLGNCAPEPFKLTSRGQGQFKPRIKGQQYCCYNSPMARIFSEQVAKNLNLSKEEIKRREQENEEAIAAGKWTGEENGCGGVRISDLEKVNWDNIDLSEWTALLQKYDLDIKPSEMSMESLTGEGSDMAKVFEQQDKTKRKNAAERTVERLTPDLEDEYHYDKIFNKQRNDIEKSISFD